LELKGFRKMKGRITMDRVTDTEEISWIRKMEIYVLW
jgi:hypothetical protein